MKMKGENICTTLHEGDGGSASLSLLHQCLEDREIGQKRLERGCKGQEQERQNTTDKRSSVTHLQRGRGSLGCHWMGPPACLDESRLGWSSFLKAMQRWNGDWLFMHPLCQALKRESCTFVLYFTSQNINKAELFSWEVKVAKPILLFCGWEAHHDTVVTLSAL